MQKLLQQEDVPLISVSLLSLSWWLSKAQLASFPLQQRKEMGMEGKQSLLHAVSSAPCCVPTNHTGRMRCWICPLFSCSTLSPRCALWFLYLLLEAQGWGRHCRQDVTLNLKRGRVAGGGGLRVTRCKHRGCFTNQPLPTSNQQPHRDPLSPWGRGWW